MLNNMNKEQIKIALDIKLQTKFISINLRQTTDTMDCCILHNDGIKDTELNWVKSHLRVRKQFMKCGNV